MAFKSRLLQPMWMLQSKGIAIYPREVKIPIVSLFAGSQSVIHKDPERHGKLYILFNGKWHNWYFDLSWENSNIPELQHPN